MHIYNPLYRILCFLLLVTGCFGFALAQKTQNEGEKFTLVIDAGHGGKDPGAIGHIAREKNINLKVAKAFGTLVENHCKDVRVVYTRETDIFIPLEDRARIANEVHADLFVSIHTNALPKGKIGRGAETYTLGMARAQANLDVAKRENAAILIESNYEERYEGFDPNSSESYIIFEFMQDKYMKQSVDFAKHIQTEFKTTAKRNDKGVHQAGFLVLRQVSMPSVLIELGYISTRDEENFLQSKEGIKKMSQSIYNAFITYKEQNYKKQPKITATEGDTSINPPSRTQKQTQDDRIVLMVQIMTSGKKISLQDKRFKGLSPIGLYEENGTFKYTFGKTDSYKEAQKLREKAKKLFPGAFIIALRNGKKIALKDAMNEIKE